MTETDLVIDDLVMTEPTGSLSVLNVGAGDLTITFNQEDAEETAKAIQMLIDMQRRGYAILVQTPEGDYQRATAIDATRGRYIITLPTGPAIETALAQAAAPSPEVEFVTCACGCGVPVTAGKTWVKGHSHRGVGGYGKKKVRVSVPVTKRHAAGVARSAGG